MLAETSLPLPKLFVKKYLNRGSIIISKLLPSYQRFIYATNIVKKEQMYIVREDKKKIFSYVDLTRLYNVISNVHFKENLRQEQHAPVYLKSNTITLKNIYSLVK